MPLSCKISWICGLSDSVRVRISGFESVFETRVIAF